MIPGIPFAVRKSATAARVTRITRLAESGVTISVCPWVNVPDYIAAVNELNKTILETFRARNIVIPLPQREVRMLGSEGSAAS